MSQQVSLTSLDRKLLFVPLLGGIVFGILPLVPSLFAVLFGFSGLDGYIYQLAGAATFGYAIVLWQAVFGQASWDEIKYSVAATLAFNLISLYACANAILAGNPQLVVYLILGFSVAITAITSRLVIKNGLQPNGKKDIAMWVTILLFLTTIAAVVFGIFPLFTRLFATIFGYTGTDVFIFQQAGAACFGYAVMGILELRSQILREIRLPLQMGFTFNGISLVVSALQFFFGTKTLLVYIVVAATFIFTIGFWFALQRKRK